MLLGFLGLRWRGSWGGWGSRSRGAYPSRTAMLLSNAGSAGGLTTHLHDVFHIVTNSQYYLKDLRATKKGEGSVVEGKGQPLLREDGARSVAGRAARTSERDGGVLRGRAGVQRRYRRWVSGGPGLVSANISRHQVPRRISWVGRVQRRLVSWYWNAPWPSAVRVRRALLRYHGFPLPQGGPVAFTRDHAGMPHPTRTSGVVYAIVCKYSRGVYVGQTQHTAFKRFQEHVRCAGRVARLGKHARVQDSSDFHVSMARIGWEDFMVIPLVHVPRGDRSMEDWVTALRVVEDEWIARFQSWAPRGFNSRWNALRAQPFGAVRRRANGNLMLRNRRRDPNSVNAEYGSMGQAARGRKYAFRNWNRRCLCWAEMCQRGRDPTPIIRVCDWLVPCRLTALMCVCVSRPKREASAHQRLGPALRPPCTFSAEGPAHESTGRPVCHEHGPGRICRGI